MPSEMVSPGRLCKRKIGCSELAHYALTAHCSMVTALARKAPARRVQGRKHQRSLGLPWEGRDALIDRIVRGLKLYWLPVIFLFAGLIWLAVRTAQRQEAERATWRAHAQLASAIERFRVDVGRCPRTLGELLHPPQGWESYLSAVPKDGFGRAFYFACPVAGAPIGYDLISAGPSGDFHKPDNLY